MSLIIAGGGGGGGFQNFFFGGGGSYCFQGNGGKIRRFRHILKGKV